MNSPYVLRKKVPREVRTLTELLPTDFKSQIACFTAYLSVTIRAYLLEFSRPGFEIVLNKEKALDWSHFDLELVFPVKKMKGL